MVVRPTTYRLTFEDAVNIWLRHWNGEFQRSAIPTADCIGTRCRPRRPSDVKLRADKRGCAERRDHIIVYGNAEIEDLLHAPVRVVQIKLIHFDLHRAFGLWVWPLLLVFALSSVSLNLKNEVYEPFMKTVFGLLEAGVMKMRQLTAIELPPGSSIEAKPGGRHIMFVGVPTANQILAY